MKNIMIIVPSLSGGGAERLAADLSRELNDKYNVSIVVYQKSEKEYEYKGTRYDLNLFSASLTGAVICAVKRCIKVKRLKRNLKTDLSISFLPNADYVNIFSKRKNEKVIISVVSNMSLAFPKGIKRIFRKYILKRADHIVSVSQGVREDLVKAFKIPLSKASVIYNSCDIDIFGQGYNPGLLRSLCNPLKGPYIITAGSFRHPKGHWHLIKAFSLVLSSYPQSALIILGDGVYKEKYKSLIDLLGLNENVFLPGFVSNVREYFSCADLFVLSSVYEGFATVLVEALACSLPIVSTDCQFGPREILAPDTPVAAKATDIQMAEYGILTPPFDNTPIEISTDLSQEEIKFSDAIVLALAQKRDPASIAANKKYCLRFGLDAIACQWDKLINSLLL